MKKKAALELSITAIVVLIIAITVLGLGIGFIKKQFGAGTKLVEAQLGEIREQIRNQIKTGGELLVFNFPDEVSIGKPAGIVIGVRNNDANPESGEICFRVEIKCKTPFTPGAFCDPVNMRNNVAVGGFAMTGEDADGQAVTTNSWFRSILGQFDLRNYEGDVYDAILLVRGVKPDLYAMEVNVFQEPNKHSCSNADFNYGPDVIPYASKTFTLNVV
ncbi:hypothetical protein DRJ22_03295 [Candidatus Woesearchaeota archaeon]|nr:MAG: hypothetical protein DRJ22_03295 [Candidatus Woesearchaeota archaeon]